MMILILGSEFSPDMAYLNYHLQRTAKMKEFLLQEDFLTFSDNYSYLFKPMVELQSKLRKISLGKSNWINIRKRQKSIKEIIAYREMNNGSYPSFISSSSSGCLCCYSCVESYRRMFNIHNPMEYEYEMPPELAKCQYKTTIKIFYGKYNVYFKKNQRQVDLKSHELNPQNNNNNECNTYNTVTNNTKSTYSKSSKQRINSTSSGKFISPPVVSHTSFPSPSKSLTILNNNTNIERVNNHQHYHSCTNITHFHDSLLIRNAEMKKEKLHSDTTSSNTHGPSCSITDGTPNSNLVV